MLKYREYAIRLFQFCVGSLNVNSDVRLYNSELSDKPMYMKILDGYVNYLRWYFYLINIRMRGLIQQANHDIFGINKFYSNEEFKRLIGKFKDIRNSASHYGVEWNEGYEIYDHLVLLVYYAIMERSGFEKRERTGILIGLFFHRF